MIYMKDGPQLSAYQHELNGSLRKGLFYGFGSSTTWAFKYFRPKECGGPLDFYFARLLKPGEPAKEGEVKGFLTSEIP